MRIYSVYHPIQKYESIEFDSSDFVCKKIAQRDDFIGVLLLSTKYINPFFKRGIFQFSFMNLVN